MVFSPLIHLFLFSQHLAAFAHTRGGSGGSLEPFYARRGANGGNYYCNGTLVRKQDAKHLQQAADQKTCRAGRYDTRTSTNKNTSSACVISPQTEMNPGYTIILCNIMIQYSSMEVYQPLRGSSAFFFLKHNQTTVELLVLLFRCVNRACVCHQGAHPMVVLCSPFAVPCLVRSLPRVLHSNPPR